MGPKLPLINQQHVITFTTMFRLHQPSISTSTGIGTQRGERRTRKQVLSTSLQKASKRASFSCLTPTFLLLRSIPISLSCLGRTFLILMSRIMETEERTKNQQPKISFLLFDPFPGQITWYTSEEQMKGVRLPL